MHGRLSTSRESETSETPRGLFVPRDLHPPRILEELGLSSSFPPPPSIPSRFLPDPPYSSPYELRCCAKEHEERFYGMTSSSAGPV